MLRKSAIILAAAAVLCYLFSSTLLGAMGAYLVQAESPTKADIVLVLAGDSSGRRILRAAELVRDGYASQALVSGPSGVYGLYECELAIPFAVKAGFPESYFIHLEHRARSTREEAQSAVAEMRRRGVQRYILVTSDFHTRRATRLFRETAPDLEFTTVAAPDEHFTADGWWHSREGQKTTFYEWVKTVTSWFGI